MDTSKADDAYDVLRGTAKILVEDIPQETWIRVVEDLYRQHAISEEIPGLFTEFHLFLNREGHTWGVPRGMTRFDQAPGFGVQTLCCRASLWRPPRFGGVQELLLVKSGSSLKWAVWETTYRFRLGDVNARYLSSNVAWVEKESLAQFCDGHFPYEHYLERLKKVCNDQAEKFQRALTQVQATAQEIESMTHRRIKYRC